MKAILGLGLAMALVIGVPTGATAMGTGDSSSSSSAGSSSSSKKSVDGDFLAAKKKVDAQEYADAIPLLRKIVQGNPRHANALNLLGYSYRKSGDVQKALRYYQAALKVDPNHLGANEYLGELYLEMGDLGKAEERLQVLQAACKNCEELTELKAGIEAFKAKQS